MYKIKPVYHLLIRIGILILLLISVFVYSWLTYDPNEYSRHLDPKIGPDVLAFFLTQIYCAFLLLEMIYFFVKKHKTLALTNLVLLIIIEIIPISF